MSIEIEELSSWKSLDTARGSRFERVELLEIPFEKRMATKEERIGSTIVVFWEKDRNDCRAGRQGMANPDLQRQSKGCKFHELAERSEQKTD